MNKQSFIIIQEYYYCAMYDFLDGKFEEMTPTQVVVNCAGVGFLVFISLNTFERIREQKEGRLKVHHVVKEDAHQLFGFADAAEREVFRNLISISGIGATTARMILSSLTSSEVIKAIQQENVALLKSVKGIGPKAAQRIVLELKDKTGRMDWTGVSQMAAVNQPFQEALDALLALGFNRLQTEKALVKVKQELGNDASTESLIKNCLKIL